MAHRTPPPYPEGINGKFTSGYQPCQRTFRDTTMDGKIAITNKRMADLLVKEIILQQLIDGNYVKPEAAHLLHVLTHL
jgi:hypothetical protein